MAYALKSIEICQHNLIAIDQNIRIFLYVFFFCFLVDFLVVYTIETFVLIILPITEDEGHFIRPPILKLVCWFFPPNQKPQFNKQFKFFAIQFTVWNSTRAQ